MRHLHRKITVLAGVAVVALLAASPAPAVAASTAPVPAPAPVSAASDGSLSMDSTGSSEALAAVCVFTTRGDYVHVSSSAFEASGHGWWVNGNCNTSTAIVTVQLQEYYSDGSWRNKGVVGRSTVRSGGGAGNRATGRAACSNSSLTGWRSVVDVDLVGLADDPGKLTTPGRDIGCRVP